MDRNKQNLDSDGNRVYVGNFDQNGLNINNNWDDNRNDNIGLASSVHSHLQSKNPPPTEVFRLLRFGFSNPTTQHPSYLINHFLNRNIFLILQSSDIFGQTDINSKKI